jgi:hypothetical protein
MPASRGLEPVGAHAHRFLLSVCRVCVATYLENSTCREEDILSTFARDGKLQSFIIKFGGREVILPPPEHIPLRGNRKFAKGPLPFI